MQIVGKTTLNYLFTLQLETLCFKGCLVSMMQVAKSAQIKHCSILPNFDGPVEMHRSCLWFDSSVTSYIAVAQQCK